VSKASCQTVLREETVRHQQNPSGFKPRDLRGQFLAGSRSDEHGGKQSETLQLFFPPPYHP